jgi:hypothetical protein
MVLNLTVPQVKEAVAEYVNNKGILSNDYHVLPDHVRISQHTEGRFDEAENIFDGVVIDVEAAKKKK